MTRPPLTNAELLAKAEGRLPGDPNVMPPSVELIRENLLRSRRRLRRVRKL